MKKLFICAFLVYAASLQAQPMGKGNLPPVFPKEVAEKTQFDTRTRAYISPVRVMWTQNGDLITGSENLLFRQRAGYDGQYPENRFRIQRG